MSKLTLRRPFNSLYNIEKVDTVLYTTITFIIPQENIQRKTMYFIDYLPFLYSVHHGVDLINKNKKYEKI